MRVALSGSLLRPTTWGFSQSGREGDEEEVVMVASQLTEWDTEIHRDFTELHRENQNAVTL
jgi:hypothetical protein